VPLLEVYTVKDLEVLRLTIRGRYRIVWRDRLTKRFVKKHSIKVTIVRECESYEEIERKRLRVHGYCTYWLDPKPDVSIESQVNDVLDSLRIELKSGEIEIGFEAFMDYCEESNEIAENEEIEPDDYRLAGWCECKIAWKHKPEEPWREEVWICRMQV